MTARLSNAPDGAGASLYESARAALVIKGESPARAWLDRLQADITQPSELAHHDVVDLAPLGAAAARAVVTPKSDNAHLAVGEVGKQGAGDCLIFEQQEDNGKRFATLQALLALAGGFTLLELADGSYLVTRWNCCRPLADLRAVAAFVRQMGGAA